MALPPVYVHVHMHMHIYHRKYLTAAKQKEIAGMALQPSGEPFSKSLAECELILRELKHVDSTSQEKQI